MPWFSLDIIVMYAALNIDINLEMKYIISTLPLDICFIQIPTFSLRFQLELLTHTAIMIYQAALYLECKYLTKIKCWQPQLQ